jgi:hypothetical protein
MTGCNEDLRAMLLTTCVLKRVHQASMAIVLASREDSVQESTADAPLGSPTLVAFIVGDNKTPTANNNAQQQDHTHFHPQSRKATGVELDNDIQEKINTAGFDGGDEDTANSRTSETFVIHGGPPQKRRRGRRVSKALRGLAHGLLLRKRSSDEKKDAQAALTSKVFEFDR